ncbi:hypothetical protein [Tenacibaculum aiptasiae]|uniref:hypothetical protein n=1 Tax=Tenacibaculum aiptasiae TaxID=426481 RepID=UPI00232B1B63|nr:hypothetical protein [Tenacibaculum aiptasiae]
MKNQYKANKQQTLFLKACKLVKTPILLALLLTPIRFILELIGLPENLIFLLGLLWLTIGVAIYWTIKHYTDKRFFLLLLLSLVIYSPISRIPVALAWWTDTYWQLGTHYGLYFDNFIQVLWNQMIYGSLIQIISGLLIGSITFAIMQYKQVLKLKSNTVNNE